MKGFLNTRQDINAGKFKTRGREICFIEHSRHMPGSLYAFSNLISTFSNLKACHYLLLHMFFHKAKKAQRS